MYTQAPKNCSVCIMFQDTKYLPLINKVHVTYWQWNKKLNLDKLKLRYRYLKLSWTLKKLEVLFLNSTQKNDKSDIICSWNFSPEVN